jgi:hypothetical protein
LFLFKKLREQNTDLINQLLDALKKRFVERRNQDLVSFMRYLQNPPLPRAEKNYEISNSSKTAIINTAKKILQRNFSSDFALPKKLFFLNSSITVLFITRSYVIWLEG